jgi:alpha-tubulin suppressor-like RCC1 family protein
MSLDIGSACWVPVTAQQGTVSVPAEFFKLGPNCSLAYIPARLVRVEGVTNSIGVFAVEWDERQEIKCNIANVQHRNWPMDEGRSPESIDEISVGNIASIVYALSLRHQAGKCMSLMSSILLWTNPMGMPKHKTGAYENRIEHMDEVYKASQRNLLTGVTTGNNVIYPVIEKVRVAALSPPDGEQKNQALIFRGCAGSGKSEAIKAAVQYFMYVDTLRNENSTGAKETAIQGMLAISEEFRNKEEYRYLGGRHNPMLHDTTLSCNGHVAEGIHIHASIAAAILLMDTLTTRPTPFGKRSSRSLNRIRLMFNQNTKKLQHFDIMCLLLDKSPNCFGAGAGREYGQPYMIFPMVMASSTMVDLGKLGITGKMREAYINDSPHMSEAELVEEYAHFNAVMIKAGVTEAQLGEMEKAIKAIVLMQNLAVVGNDSAFIGGPSVQVLEAAEKLLGSPNGSLKEVVLKNDMGRLGVMNHKPDGSREVVYGICVSIYYRVCAMLSTAVSGASFFDEMLSSRVMSGGDPPVPPGCTTVELVDTMGYEETDVGKSGNLEQLMINYAAERVFCQYANLNFEATIQLYAADGVKMGNYEPPSFIWTVDLFDKIKVGLVALTEEVCMSMRPEDKQIGDRYTAEYGKVKLVRPAGMKSKRSEFFVRHHFSDCLYDYEGYVKASRGPIMATKGVEAYLNTSSIPIIRSLGEQIMEQTSESEQSSRAVEARGRPGPSNIKALQAKGLVLSRAKDTLTRTLTALQSSEVSYVLCLKPNSDPKEYHFDPKLMTAQVKHHALEELHRMSLQGYRNQVPYADFYRKFCRAISPFSDIEKHPKAPSSSDASKVLKWCLAEAAHMGLIKDEEEAAKYAEGAEDAAQFGNKNMYYRSPLSRIIEEVFVAKTGRYGGAASKIVAIYRSYRMFMAFRKMVRGAVLIASHARRKINRKNFLRERYLVSRLRANIYCRRQRVIYLRWKQSINLLKRTMFRPVFFFDRMRYVKLQRAMLSLQQMARGAVVAAQSRYVMSMVSTMWRACIRFVTHCRIFYRRRWAATLVQRLTRGYTWRKMHPKTMHILLMKRRFRRAMRATRAIQQKFRCRNISRKFQQIREAARVVQHWTICRLDRLRLLKVKTAIRWFQCTTRRIIAADKVSYMMAARMMHEEAARQNIVRRNEIEQVVQKHEEVKSGINDMDPGASSEYINVGNGNTPGSSARVIGSATTFDSGYVSFVVGSGMLKNGHTLFLKTLAAFDVSGDITAAYPAGFVSPIITHNANLNRHTNFLVKIALGSAHTVLMDDAHNIYGFGLNGGGEYGNENFIGFERPTKLANLMKHMKNDEMFYSKDKVHNKLVNVPVKEVVCGREHTCILSQSGLVWSWGRNTRGQLGHSNFQGSAIPKLLRQKGGRNNEPMRNITHLSCAGMHSACIDDHGTLYTWGAYECLGQEPPDDIVEKGSKTTSLKVHDAPKFKYRPDRSEPGVVPFFHTNAATGKFVVSHLCCGDNHVSVIATPVLKAAKVGTSVYSWGNNSYGQLGIGDKRCVLAFTPRRAALRVLIEGLNTRKPDAAAAATGAGVHFDEIKLVCGGRHMMLLHKNQIWAWGWNKFGQLGTGSAANEEYTPTAIDMGDLTSHIGGDHKKHLQSIVSVSCGWKVSAAVNNAGDFFVWGTPGLTPSGVHLTEGERERATSLSDADSKKRALYGDLGSPKDSSAGHRASGASARGGKEEEDDEMGMPTLRVPTFLDCDEARVGHPMGVHVYGNQTVSMTLVKGVDPRAADWSLSASGAVRSDEVIKQYELHKSGHFSHHLDRVTPNKIPYEVRRNQSMHVSMSPKHSPSHKGPRHFFPEDDLGSNLVSPGSFKYGSTSPTRAKLGSEGRSISPFFDGPGQSLGQRQLRTTPIKGDCSQNATSGYPANSGSRSRSRSRSTNGHPRGTTGEKVYRGSISVQVAESRRLDVEEAVEERLRSSSPNRPSLKLSNGLNRGASDRVTPKELVPKMPYHHRDSDRKVHKNREITQKAKADDVLDAFRKEGLARGMHAHAFLKGSKRGDNTVTDTSPPKPMERPLSPHASRAERRNSLRQSLSQRESEQGLKSPGATINDGPTHLQLGLGRTGRYSVYTPTSQHASMRVTKVVESPRKERTLREIPGDGVTDKGIRGLLLSKPKGDGGIKLDPTKPSTRIFSKVAKGRARGLGMPMDERKKILTSLNEMQLMNDYGSNLDELGEHDPYNIMHGKDRNRSHQRYTVDENFLSFIDQVVHADAQYDPKASQFEHSDDDDYNDPLIDGGASNDDDEAASTSSAGSLTLEALTSGAGEKMGAKSAAMRKYDAKRKAAYVKAASADFARGLHASVDQSLKSGQDIKDDLDYLPGGMEEDEDESLEYLANIRRELGLAAPATDKLQKEAERDDNEKEKELLPAGAAALGQRTSGTAFTKSRDAAATRNVKLMSRFGSYGFMSKEAADATSLGQGLESIHMSSVRDLNNQIQSLKTEQLAKMMDDFDQD